ncbi:MAG: HD-GYP domain-containing protein [Treponema sp.]|jgi:HD-GYP domain-containing protein (c-di-GMP phosphodiesterase class II)|nr:HD-GYP domain-containing protein [Treponema sp.]
MITSASLDVQENKEPYRAYLSLIEQLNTVFERLSGGFVTSNDVDIIADQLLDLVREERLKAAGYILCGKVEGRELAKNSINTAILSALTAKEFKASGRIVLQLVTGALLHDTGMLRLPPNILRKRGGLSGAELQQMQAHPLHSYHIICQALSYPDDIGRIAMQHHERWDGGGYPLGVAGAAIVLEARIISVADAFEAMVSEKPYRDSIIGYQAMKNLLSDNSSRFDPDVLKAFIKIMGIYPIGSLVLLNNKAVAQVVEVRGDAPLRPRVRILIDETGGSSKPNEEPVLDLLNEKSFFIVKALDSREVAAKSE